MIRLRAKLKHPLAKLAWIRPLVCVACVLALATVAKQNLPVRFHAVSLNNFRGFLAKQQETTDNKIRKQIENRLQHVSDHCSNMRKPGLGNSTTSENDLKQKSWRYMIVDDKNKVMFCYVSKAGNSHWKAVMAVMGHSIKKPQEFQFNTTEDVPTDTGSVIHEPWFFKKLSDYKSEDIKKMLTDKNYKKFMAVRHPFTRLLSAYKDKFALSNAIVRAKYDRRYGKYIFNKYQHKNFSEAEPGYKVSWKAFARYIADPSLTTLDEHWEVQSRLCNPCHIDFNFITQLEHSDVEAFYWLRQLEEGLDGNIHLTYQGPYSDHVTTKMARNYFSMLPKHVVKNLYAKYKQDFELFGYNASKVATNINF